MGAILGRQSYDFGRIRILVYGSLVQKSLNGLNDSIMIIVETEINLYKTDCDFADITYFTFYQKTFSRYVNCKF